MAIIAPRLVTMISKMLFNFVSELLSLSPSSPARQTALTGISAARVRIAAAGIGIVTARVVGISEDN